MTETDKTAADAQENAADSQKQDKSARPIKAAAEKAKNGSPGNILRGFAAGLIGGVIVLFGGSALLYSGALPLPGNRPNAAAQAAIFGAQKRELLAAMDRRFDEETQLLAQTNAQTEAQLRQLTAKAEAAAAQATQNNGGAQAQMQQAVQALAERQNAQAAAIAANGNALAALKAALAANDDHDHQLLARTEALRLGLNQLEQKRQNSQAAMVNLAALQNFQAAFSSGSSYAAQLQIFNAAFPHIWQEIGGGDPAALAAALDSYAAGGLPDNAVLAARLTPLADKLAAQNDSAAGSSLWAKAQSWLGISIRPQGQAEGNTPAARLARLEQALNEGNVKAALVQAQALPAAQQTELAAIITPLKLKLIGQRAFAAAAGQIFPAGNKDAAAASQPAAQPPSPQAQTAPAAPIAPAQQ